MLSSRYLPLITAVFIAFSIAMTPQKTNGQSDFTVDINVVKPDGEVVKTDTIVPGDTLKMRGLPIPLQILNNAELHLPEEAVAEDIRVEIGLPDFSEISEQAPQEVRFGQNIANAIEINVFVNDTLVSPYEFEEPVELTLPIPENKPEGVGEDVSQFILAYFDDDGQRMDSDAISTEARDSINQFVRARVGHFSNIGLTSDQEVTSAEDEHTHPDRITLEHNYPNPFNPVTEIRFDLPRQAEVRLEVFNTLGESVTVLKDETMSAGTHHVRWDASHVSSGVFIYRLTAGDQVLSRTMTLIK